MKPDKKSKSRRRELYVKVQFIYEKRVKIYIVHLDFLHLSRELIYKLTCEVKKQNSVCFIDAIVEVILKNTRIETNRSNSVCPLQLLSLVHLKISKNGTYLILSVFCNYPV